MYYCSSTLRCSPFVESSGSSEGHNTQGLVEEEGVEEVAIATAAEEVVVVEEVVVIVLAVIK